MFGPVCDDLKPRAHSPRKYRLKSDGRVKVPCIEVRYVEQITTMMIADFIRERADADDLKPKTVNRYREVLQRFFNWAMEEGGVRMPGGINPVKRVKRRPEGDRTIRFLTKEDIAEQLRCPGRGGYGPQTTSKSNNDGKTCLDSVCIHP
jgi:integrase